MSSVESIELTIGYLELQYQMALAEIRHCEIAAAAWKKISRYMNSQLTHLTKKYVNNTYPSNSDDHVIININDTA
jgi:hypothetical protein